MSLFFDLWRTRELLISLVKRDLKVRYKDSILGFFWSFGRPLFLMATLAIVFSMILGFGYGEERAAQVPYPLFLLTGILPWMYLAGALSEGTPVMLGNSSLIKKVSINVAVFPASVVLGHLVHLALAFVVYFAFLVYYGRGVSFDLWILVPTVAVQTLFILALTLACSALNVFYRDVSSIVEVFLTAWFYVTPILYPVDVAFRELAARLPEHATWWQALYLLNPMAPVMMGYRRALVFDGEAPLREMSDAHLALALLGAAAISAAVYVFCWAIFRRFAHHLADEL